MADDLNIQAGVTVNAEQAEAAFARVGDKAEKMANDVATSAGKAGKAVDKIGDGADKGAEKFTRAESRMREAIVKSTRELEMFGKTASQKFEAKLEFKGLDKAKFEPALNELRKAEEATKRAQAGFHGMGDAAQVASRAIAVAFSGAALAGFVGKVVAVQREFDVLNSSLKTVTGSSAAAEREMAWLKDFAKETPFGLAQATQGFVKMKALGLDPTRAALTSFGNTASAMGKDLNQMIEAVADASTGEFERLKEFGIKAKKEGDNVSLTFQGVTTTIRNSAAEITKYLQNIGDTEFGGAMEQRAKTLDGTIAALGDTWDELFRTVSSSNVGSLIFDSVTLANGVLEDATVLLRAMGSAAQDAGRDTGSLATIQNGIATVFETVSVLGANLKFVLVGIGNEIGGLAAQVAQAAQFNFSGVAAIRRQMVADAEAARKEIDATTARILNARKAQEEYARYATRNASAATDPRRVDLGGSTPRATGGVSSGAAKAVKEVISEYDKLIKKLSEELPKAAAEAEAAQMGYNKSQTEFLAIAGSPTWASFTNSQRAVVASMFESKIASEQAGDAVKELSKAYAEAAAERIKTIQSMERAADGLQSQNDALREEIELIGLSTEQQTLILQQRNDAIILTKEATLAELERQSAITGTQTRVEIALASEIEALKERNALLGAKGVKNAAVDAAKTAADEWQKTTDSINQSLTDSLLRGFESGKDFAKNLRDTVVNMFKTMVLRPVISAIVNPISQGITGMMGLSGAAQAGQGASALGTVGNVASLASGIGSFTTAGMLPTGLATALTGSTSSLAMGLSGAWGAGGGMLSTLNAGASMIGSGSIMSGLGTLAGALGPIALGIAALVAIFGKKATPHAGAASTYSEAGGLVSGADIYRASGLADTRTYNAGVEQVTGNVAKAIGDTLNATAKAFGQTAGYEITTAFADDTSKDGAWGSLIIKQMGKTVLDWRDTQTDEWAPKVFADGEAGGKEFLAEAAKGARDALVSIGLPEWAERLAKAAPEPKSLEDLNAMLQQISQYPAQLLQQFGTSRDALVQQFAQGLASGDAMAAGQSVADTLVASIQNAVFTSGAGQIFDIVNQGIVAPMLDAIATGASVSEALSQATIDKTIERAKAQAQVLGELFGNQEFAAAMEQLRTAVGGALGQAGGYLQALPQTLVATQQIDTAAQDAARAADEAQKAWQQITDGLLSDQGALQIELLRAQGREEEALARERALAIEGMDAYQTALYDSNRALRSQIDTLRELGELLPSVIDQYLTPEQRTSNAYGTIANDLVGAGLAGMSAGALAQALAGATKGEIAEAATAIYNMTGVTDEMRVALLRAAGSLATLKDEAQATADAGLDTAYGALERAVQARRSVVQETISDVRAVFDTVRSASRSLFGEVDRVVQFQADAGRAFITQALGTARSTGYLPDGEQLSEAIDAARAGLQGNVFASQAEADYQKLVLANELRSLQDISGDQLTEAEQQLKALDGILDNARAQMDALRGIDNSVMSVEAALQQFGNAILGLSGKPAAGAAGKAGGAAAGAMPDWATFGVGDWMTSSTGNVFDASTGMLYGPGDVTSHSAQLRDAAAAMLEAGQSKELYDAVRASGFTLEQADSILRLPEGKAEEWARSLGLPIFHGGTPYVPRTGFAVLEQGEAVIPRAFNPFTGGAGGNNNARLEALVEAMATELAQMRAQLDEANRHAARTADATNGRPEAPVLVEVVA